MLRSYGFLKIYLEKNILLYVFKLILYEVILDMKYDFIVCDMYEVVVGYKFLFLLVILKWVFVEFFIVFDYCNNEVFLFYSVRLKNKV